LSNRIRAGGWLLRRYRDGKDAEEQNQDETTPHAASHLGDQALTRDSTFGVA
jgi:hypothetical protein